MEEYSQQKERHPENVDPDVIFHNFSPLVASLRVMRTQLNNAYNTITGQNGYLVVLKEFSDYVYIAVNGDGEETEEFLQRKLRVLHRIVTFLHGPCLERLRPNRPKERNERWKVIGDLLLTWSDLHHSEHTFLVEAMERLHINEQVNKTCVELLEGALNGMKAAGEKHAVHAMLVTETKLMALFSSRNATDLSHGDQLMLLLLVNSLFRGIRVTGSHSHLATLSSRDIKKRVKPPKGPVNISRQSSRTPLLESGDNATSGTDDTTDSENLLGHDSCTSSDDAGLVTGSVFQVSSESPSSTAGSSPSQNTMLDGQSARLCDKITSSQRSPIGEGQRNLSPHQEVPEESSPPVNETQSEISPADKVLPNSSRTSSRAAQSDRSTSSRRSSSMKRSQSDSNTLLPPLSIVSKSNSTELGSQKEYRSSNSSFEHIGFQSSSNNSQQLEKNTQQPDNYRQSDINRKSDIHPQSDHSRQSNIHQQSDYNQQSNIHEKMDIRQQSDIHQQWDINRHSDGIEEPQSHQQLSSQPWGDHHRHDQQLNTKKTNFRHSLSASFSMDSSQHSQFTPEMTNELVGSHNRSASALERSCNHSGTLTSHFGPVPKLTVIRDSNHSNHFHRLREEEVMDYDNPTVLLGQGTCPNVPHSVHCVLVMDGVYLVIVCQVAKVTHAQTITHALSTVEDILAAANHMTSTQPIKQLQDTMDSVVKKIGDILKKSKGVPHIERIIVDIGAKWDQAKQCDLIKTLSRPSQEDELSGRLTGTLSVLQDKLRQLFQVLYLTKRHSFPQHHQSILNGIGNIQATIRRSLGDYVDYIGIMAHRNMPMSIYIDEFPGMVHFIFVNRTSNVMVAPSFHTNLYEDEDRTHHTSQLVKEKVWEMYSWMRQQLTDGVFTVTLRETHFHFSYFVWFEDNQGGFPIPLQPTTPSSSPATQKTSPTTMTLPSSPLPGVICEPFYTRLQSQCIHGADKRHISCYELFCVHVSMVPTQYALGHCRKLKEKLWKVSVDTSAPISLL